MVVKCNAKKCKYYEYGDHCKLTNIYIEIEDIGDDGKNWDGLPLCASCSYGYL